MGAVGPILLLTDCSELLKLVDYAEGGESQGSLASDPYTVIMSGGIQALCCDNHIMISLPRL